MKARRVANEPAGRSNDVQLLSARYMGAVTRVTYKCDVCHIEYRRPYPADVTGLTGLALIEAVEMVGLFMNAGNRAEGKGRK
jgi:hypothetical protein